MPWSTVCGAIGDPPGPICWGSMGPTLWLFHSLSTTWPGPIERRISNSPPDPDAEGSDEFDGEEFEVAHNSTGHQSSNSPSHPPAKRFQSHIIPSTPRTFQQTLATLLNSLPLSSTSSFTARPAFIPAVRPSPIPQSINSPIVTSKQLQPVASSSKKREELSPLLFPAAQVFQQREHWPI
ncbi:hypothetical protein O181_071706 [Austropuccinia psidii MF-1]|uniref:Uncharacterized protein n=1 Tax=Austropuccinia psidii MF-1 TaxID=1389203 RepID=A0A9Q3F182_9BASI|nr:hypothetical protein [Austropuccinia psidii MF-1]